MNNKAILILLLALTATSVHALTRFPEIVITQINQEPDPVGPGNLVDLNLRIENAGGGPAENVDVKVVPKYPFTLYGSEEIKSIGTLEANQDGSIGAREKWTLQVDQNAATGENTIEVWYRINKGVWTQAGEYTITIRSRDAVLAIDQIISEPESIVPGTMTDVSFVVENLADNTVRDITLNLQTLQALVTTTSITYRELPFTPINSGNEKTLKSIAPGEKKRITFTLFTDAEAEIKVYKVPYTLVYSDSAGQNFSRMGIVGLVVDSMPDLSISLERTSIYSSGSKGDVVIKLVNKGFTDIKFLDVHLDRSDDYEMLTNPNVYIGKLDSDDYDTAEYTLTVGDNVKDKIVLPIRIDFRDNNGHLYTEQASLEVPLFEGAELKQRTNGNSNFTPLLLVVVVLAIVGFVLYRRAKAKRKKE